MNSGGTATWNLEEGTGIWALKTKLWINSGANWVPT